MNEIILGDAADVVNRIEKNSVDLVVTSPPYYNARPEYAEYNSLNEFMQEMIIVFGYMRKALTPGARVCINTSSGYGRSPYIHLGFEWIKMMLNLGYKMRGEIVWNKGASAGNSTAWGSWRNPSSPHIRDVHEMIYVFDYGGHRLEGCKDDATIDGEEFMLATQSVWNIPTVSSQLHPAVMPIAIASRLIELYSYRDNVVLDPFCGSGTTCKAASNLGRRYIGIEREADYVEVAKNQLAQHRLFL